MEKTGPVLESDVDEILVAVIEPNIVTFLLLKDIALNTLLLVLNVGLDMAYARFEVLNVAFDTVAARLDAKLPAVTLKDDTALLAYERSFAGDFPGYPTRFEARAEIPSKCEACNDPVTYNDPAIVKSDELFIKTRHLLLMHY